MFKRREVRQELRKNSIIQAAAEVFTEKGIQGATLEQIGERVGLSKASLYYYVKSKEDLLADVLEYVLTQIDEEAEERVFEGMDPVQALKIRCFTHVMTAFYSPAGALVVSNLDALIHNKRAAAMLKIHEERVKGLVEDAQEKGMFRKVSSKAATKFLYGGINNISKWVKKDEKEIEYWFQQTWDVFMEGMLLK